MRKIIVAMSVVVLALAFVFATAGTPPPTPNPPGTFSFAALGDAPYYWWEELRFRLVLRAIDEHDLSAVIHVGDIFWRPCSDEMYRSFRDRFDALRHPVIYTPGDNEWTDCWEPGSGGYAPLERLAALRRVFFANPARSLGSRRIALVHQGRMPENARWLHEGVVFATMHIVGSDNGTGRTAAEDVVAQERLGGAIAWMRETFAEARARRAPAVVLAFHATLGIDLPLGHLARRPYEPFLVALEDEFTRFRAPVLLVHGEQHEFIVDHPLAKNVTRLEVPGSPLVGWVRVTVDPRSRQPFAFENHIVKKYW